jgi:hypothetical protein
MINFKNIAALLLICAGFILTTIAIISPLVFSFEATSQDAITYLTLLVVGLLGGVGCLVAGLDLWSA